MARPADDVVTIRLRSLAGRVAGYQVHLFVTRGVLVDTGFPRAERRVRAAVREFGVRGAYVTHHHEDHAGNVAALAATGLPVAMADATRAALRTPEHVLLYRRLVWGACPPLRDEPEPFAHDALRLVPAPGHSPDHHVVWDADRGDCFAGDLFLGVRVTIAHAGEDVRQLSRSLRAIAALAPARVFDAHRGLVPDAVPRLLAKAEWIDEMVGRIEQLADEGLTPREIRRRLFGREALEGVVSGGEYSRDRFVRAVLEGRR